MRKLCLIIGLVILGITSYAQENVGIGTPNPTNPLHISPISPGVTDPLRVEDFQRFQVNDSTILVVDPVDGSIRFMGFKELSQRIDITQVPNLDSLIQIISEQTTDSIIQTNDFVNYITSIIHDNGDTLLNNIGFTDSMTVIVFQNLLNDTNFLNLFNLQDTDIDSAQLNGYVLSIFEDSTQVVVDLQAIADSA
ncbi:MAG: hypothetical protein MRY83_24500, partial [Flavobacteriales bacterium]|nr:hypothetical protein [Flavobacteriales bacterium]